MKSNEALALIFQKDPTQRKSIGTTLYTRLHRAIFSEVLFKYSDIDNTNVQDHPRLAFAVQAMYDAILSYNPDKKAKLITWVINTIKLRFGFRWNQEEYGSLKLDNPLEYDDALYRPEEPVESPESPLFVQLDTRSHIDQLGLTDYPRIFTLKAQLGIDTHKPFTGTTLKSVTTNPVVGLQSTDADLAKLFKHS